ncbi:hypothetical protein EXQ41_06235 [Clostridium botulinum]|nr:hypothetical protein [Clostridium botulinum]MBO0555648.1 hypothetical protein [Clostridium botulinum]
MYSDYAFLLTKKAFKLLRVRSNKIKSFVIDKVTRYYKNITRKHAMKYICNIITSAREGYYNNYKNFNKKEKIDRFNDFEQREYDFEDLEKKLLDAADNKYNDSNDENGIINNEDLKRKISESANKKLLDFDD